MWAFFFFLYRGLSLVVDEGISRSTGNVNDIWVMTFLPKSSKHTTEKQRREQTCCSILVFVPEWCVKGLHNY